MNSPIPGLLLPLWQNESALCETIVMKIYVTCTVISMKIKWFHYFHGKRFAQALALQMETQTVKVKVCIHSFLFYNNFFPAQAEYSYFSADFRLKTFLYYSWIIAYDISVLEFIGVSIISVWYLDLYCVTLCMCSITRFSLQSVRSKCHVKRRH